MRLMLFIKPNSAELGMPATLIVVELVPKSIKSVNRIAAPSLNVMIKESEILLAPALFR